MRVLTIILTLLPFLASAQYSERTNAAWAGETVSFRAAMKAAKMPLTYEQLNAFDAYIKRGIPYSDTLRTGKVATNFKTDSLYARTVKWTDTASAIASRPYVSNTVTTALAARLVTAHITLDFNATQSGRSADRTATITGVAPGDVAAVNPEWFTDHTCFTAFVSGTNTITIRFNNYSTGTIDPPTANFHIVIIKTTTP